MKLLVVTDIWGRPASDDWLTERRPGIQVARYCLNELCGRPELSGEPLHRHLFEDGGIDDAVAALVDLPWRDGFGLGYSAGGTALWRAARLGLPLTGLFCLSSTRLRDEAPIETPTHVFFGAKDVARPSDSWLATTPDRNRIIPHQGHQFYRAAQSGQMTTIGDQIAAAMAQLSGRKPGDLPDDLAV